MVAKRASVGKQVLKRPAKAAPVLKRPATAAQVIKRPAAAGRDSVLRRPAADPIGVLKRPAAQDVAPDSVLKRPAGVQNEARAAVDKESISTLDMERQLADGMMRRPAQAGTPDKQSVVPDKQSEVLDGAFEAEATAAKVIKNRSKPGPKPGKHHGPGSAMMRVLDRAPVPVARSRSPDAVTRRSAKIDSSPKTPLPRFAPVTPPLDINLEAGGNTIRRRPASAPTTPQPEGSPDGLDRAVGSIGSFSRPSQARTVTARVALPVERRAVGGPAAIGREPMSPTTLGRTPTPTTPGRSPTPPANRAALAKFDTVSVEDFAGEWNLQCGSLVAKVTVARDGVFDVHEVKGQGWTTLNRRIVPVPAERTFITEIDNNVWKMIGANFRPRQDIVTWECEGLPLSIWERKRTPPGGPKVSGNTTASKAKSRARRARSPMRENEEPEWYTELRDGRIVWTNGSSVEDLGDKSSPRHKSKLQF